MFPGEGQAYQFGRMLPLPIVRISIHTARTTAHCNAGPFSRTEETSYPRQESNLQPPDPKSGASAKLGYSGKRQIMDTCRELNPLTR
jgi:hypothetical protein